METELPGDLRLHPDLVVQADPAVPADPVLPAQTAPQGADTVGPALEGTVHGTLLGAPSPADTMVRLRRLGWSVRKASWLEFDCSVDWCEVLLAPVDDDELNLSGAVDPDRLDDLADALATVGLEGHLELYDADGRLTRTVPVASPGPPAA